MLNYEEFEVELMKALDEKYPDMKKERRTQYKFNETKLGIVLEGPGAIHPVVYSDNLYEAYKEMEDMDLIMDIIESAIEYEMVEQFKEIAKDWDKARKYIYPYVVNLEKNRECIEHHGYVYQEKLDLAYGVYLELPEQNGEGNAFITITKDMLRLWDVSEVEVFEWAEHNAIYEVKPMRAVIQELIGEEDIDIEVQDDDAMFVLSNARRHRGAAGMFDMELLKQTAEEMESNFFILPSSLHEVILVLEKCSPSEEMLKESVVEINRTQVKIEDYLSDTVYYYDRKTQEVDIVEFD